MSRSDFKPGALEQLTEDSFKLNFDKLPNVTFYYQEANLPSLTLNVAEQPNLFTTIKRPSNKIEFENFTVSFIVQGDMDNFMEVFNWMKEIGSPEEVAESLKQKEEWELFSNASMEIYAPGWQSSKRVVFKDCFPTELEGINFSILSEGNPVKVNATFAYTTYDIVEVNEGVDNCDLS